MTKEKKLTKSEILKQKYGFKRNKNEETEFKEKNQKGNNDEKTKIKTYAWNSDASKKKFYG